MKLETKIELYCVVCRDYQIHEYISDWKTSLPSMEFEDLLMYNCKECGDSRVVTRARVDPQYKHWSSR